MKSKVWLSQFERFDKECTAAEETDTGEAWELLTSARDIIQELSKSRTIVVEIDGGVCGDVHGLREGDTYEVADWDDAGESENNPAWAGRNREQTQKLIDDAKAQ